MPSAFDAEGRLKTSVELPELLEQLAAVDTTGGASKVLARTAGNDGFELVAAGGGASLPLDDDVALLQNAADNTKTARFDLQSIPTGEARVFTLPDEDGTLALTGFGAHSSSASPGSSRSFSVDPQVDGTVLKIEAHGALGSVTAAFELNGQDLFGAALASIGDRWMIFMTITVLTPTTALVGWAALDSTGGGSQNQGDSIEVTGLDWTTSQTLNLSMPSGEVAHLDCYRKGGSGGGSGGGSAGAWTPYTPGLNVSNCTATGEYRENGGSIDLRIALAFTGAPSPDTGIQIGLPTGFAVAGSIVAPLDLSVEGVCCLYDVSATNPIRFFGGVTAVLPVANTLYLLMEENNRPLQPTFPLTIANGDYLWVRANGIPGSF